MKGFDELFQIINSKSWIFNYELDQNHNEYKLSKFFSQGHTVL